MQKYLNPPSASGVINTSSVSNALLTIGHYGFERSKKAKKPVQSNAWPAYRLHFIVKGSVILSFANQTVVLKKNAVFMLIPGTEISYTTDKIAETAIYWVTFNGLLAGYYATLMNMNENHPYQSLPNAQALKYFYDCFVETVDNPALREIKLLKNFYSIMEEIVKQTTVDTTDYRHNDTPDLATSVIQYINAHYTDPEISVDQLARKFYTNPNYLSTLIKKKLHVSFSKYLTVKRIEFAVQLIKTGASRVKDIAFSCGFRDELYFSKVFKTIENEAPSETIAKIQAELAERGLSQTGVNVTPPPRCKIIKHALTKSRAEALFSCLFSCLFYAFFMPFLRRFTFVFSRLKTGQQTDLKNIRRAAARGSLASGQRLAFAYNLYFGNIRIPIGIPVNIFIEHTLRVFARRGSNNISFFKIRKANFGSKIFFHFSCPPSACSRCSLNNSRTDSLSRFE